MRKYPVTVDNIVVLGKRLPRTRLNCPFGWHHPLAQQPTQRPGPHIWLDNWPIATQARSGQRANKWLHIHADHLGAPRVIIDAASNHAQWHWPLTGSAFGDHAPNPDPHNTCTPYTFNLRYPGQYFDQETGLHYNYFRDYEPQTGRYIQSDPIGLQGGMSTYGYVSANPLGSIDLLGLSECRCVAIRKDNDFTINRWWGQTRDVKCLYRCYRRDSNPEELSGSHSEWYLHSSDRDDGREGNCIGQEYHDPQFDHGRHRLIFSQNK